MQAKRLTLADVQVRIVAEPEDTTPLDSYCVPGIISKDDPDAHRFVEKVQEMIDEYGLWGWCCVRVEVRLGPLVGKEYLGGCSYEGENEFRNGGYYEQMVEAALSNLQYQVDELFPLIAA